MNDRLDKTKKEINSSNELIGACKHKWKFHRYHLATNTTSTDEGLRSLEKSKNNNLLNQSQAHDAFLCVSVEKSKGYITVDLYLLIFVKISNTKLYAV